MARRSSIQAAAAVSDADVYWALREFEQHFNQTQVEIKKLASTWMLAGLGAIAFIVRGDLKAGSSLFDTGVLLVLIGMGANVGLLSLWILDQLANQKLLGAAFRVGLLLEQYNPALPPIRSQMWVNSGNRGMPRYHALFYASAMVFNAAAAIYGYTLRSRGEWWLLVGAIIAFVAFLLPIGQWLLALFNKSFEEGATQSRQTVERWERALKNRSSPSSDNATSIRLRTAAKRSS